MCHTTSTTAPVVELEFIIDGLGLLDGGLKGARQLLEHQFLLLTQALREAVVVLLVFFALVLVADGQFFLYFFPVFPPLMLIFYFLIAGTRHDTKLSMDLILAILD